jgi:RNA-binding protein 5/10
MLIGLGLSRQFAFAQFTGVSEAKQFLEKFYPTVPLYGKYDPSQHSMEPTRARIAYSREKDDRERAGRGEDDWTCHVVCF